MNNKGIIMSSFEMPDIINIVPCNRCMLFRKENMHSILCPRCGHILCDDPNQGIKIITCKKCEFRADEHYCKKKKHAIIYELTIWERCQGRKKHSSQTSSDDSEQELSYTQANCSSDSNY